MLELARLLLLLLELALTWLLSAALLLFRLALAWSLSAAMLLLCLVLTGLLSPVELKTKFDIVHTRENPLCIDPVRIESWPPGKG